MKRFHIYAIFYTLLVPFLFSCATSEKLTSKGWQLYRNGDYSKAESKFIKALNKQTLTSTLEGMAFVKYKYRDYRAAENYSRKVYDRNKSSTSIYNYARFTNLNGNELNAMRLLYELGNQRDFETYRQLSYKENDLKSLRNNIKFQRYVSGYRRLKISPYEAYSNDEDGLGFGFHNENELFITISNNDYLILSTKIQKDKDHVFLNDYVVFDYPIGSTLEMTLIDEDIYDHDKLVSVKGNRIDVGNFTFTGNGFMKIKIEDAEERPYTTGLYVPSERNMRNDLLSICGAVLGTVVLANLDQSFVTRIISCATQYAAGSMISDPLKASMVVESVRKITENKGSISSIGTITFTSYVVAELRSKNQHQLADAVDAGMFINCIFSN